MICNGIYRFHFFSHGLRTAWGMDGSAETISNDLRARPGLDRDRRAASNSWNRRWPVRPNPAMDGRLSTGGGCRRTRLHFRLQWNIRLDESKADGSFRLEARCLQRESRNARVFRYLWPDEPSQADKPDHFRFVESRISWSVLLRYHSSRMSQMSCQAGTDKEKFISCCIDFHKIN